MKKIVDLLYDNLTEKLIQIVVSKPSKKIADANMDMEVSIKEDDKLLSAEKIKIRPVMLGDKLMFQESAYVKAQVFHQNFEKKEQVARLKYALQMRFGQMQMETEDRTASALISKKGTVTIKVKPKQNIQDTQKRDLSHNRTKNYLLPEGTKVPFLVDLGVQTVDGKIVKSRYDKFKQINRFLEFIEDVLPYLDKEKKNTILDFGCGKSYLTFAMYYYLKEKKGYDIEIIGLDLKKDVIANCNELAKKYGYTELTFMVGDVKDYNEKDEVDMVVCLHACDTATDIAIAKAICWNASVIMAVPCCQHELNAQIKCSQLEPVLRYGLLKERMAALLTDGIRACTMEAYGYDTSVLEFIDMEHTPKNILLRGIRTKGIRKKTISLEQVKEMMNMLHTEQTLVTLMENNK